MKKLIISLLMAAVLATVPVQAAETCEEDPYIWIQEGDETYCYISGSYDEAHMLTGWHQIEGELYWFEDSDFSDDRPIGSMAKNEWVDLNDMSCHFDLSGRLDEWRVGLE